MLLVFCFGLLWSGFGSCCVSMEDGMANLQLHDEEEATLHEDVPDIEEEFRLCLVGYCLT